jgi:signal transduction histidine kinase
MADKTTLGDAALRRLTGAGMSPTRASLGVALLYFLAATIYILISGQIALGNSATVEQLERFERIKGLAFVVVTSALLFGVNLTLLRRMRRYEEIERRMERSLANAERTVLAGTFARTIAHDINNALSPAMLTVSILEECVADNPEAKQGVETITQSLQRVAEWNRRFFEIGGKIVAQAGRFDLGNSVTAAVSLAKHHRNTRKATIEVESASIPGFHGVDSVIQRAVLNLVLNAVESGGADSKIVVKLEPRATHHVLTVDDNGPGVPPALRLKILEPFFTSKPDGTGLGLASVVACARLHSGEVSVHDSPLGGARFRVTLGPLDPDDPLRFPGLSDGPSVTTPGH